MFRCEMFQRLFMNMSFIHLTSKQKNSLSRSKIHLICSIFMTRDRIAIWD